MEIRIEKRYIKCENKSILRKIDLPLKLFHDYGVANADRSKKIQNITNIGFKHESHTTTLYIYNIIKRCKVKMKV